MDQGTGGSERRRLPRIPVMMQVQYTDGDSFHADYSTNLGTGGIFINTRDPLPVGESVQIQFFLPGWDHPVRLDGSVRHRTDSAAAVLASALPGFGVEFTEVSRESRTAIEHFVDRFLPREAAEAVVADDACEPSDLWIERLYEGGAH